MNEEYEDIKCFTCDQVRGKRKVVRLDEGDKAQFAGLEAEIKGHNSLFSSMPEKWSLLAGLLPVLIVIAVGIYDISALETWPRDNILRVLLSYYALWVIAYLWITHREFKKNQARVQALFRQERNILNKYGVGDKDDYIIR